MPRWDGQDLGSAQDGRQLETAVTAGASLCGAYNASRQRGGAVVKSNDIQLPHLQTFAKAAELGSFTRAATELALTQAAVSQRIQTLEKALRKSLFQRRGGRVLLTDEGHTLYAYSQRILDLHRQARREIT